ncbi:MAG: ribosome recycling factor [Christensenellales bacterium]
MAELYMNYEEEQEKAVGHLKSEFLSLRAGRANPHILDKILVNYYGAPTPLNQISNISVQDGRVLVISLWDNNAMKETLKAISASDIGITPNDDGRIIRLVFPPLTEDRRKEMVKSIHKLAEETKVVCRNARRDILDAMKKLKKDSEITEDEYNSNEKEIQKTLDNYIDKIDKETNNKEQELMQV